MKPISFKITESEITEILIQKYLTIFDKGSFKILLTYTTGALIVQVVDIQTAGPGQFENLIDLGFTLGIVEIEKIALIWMTIDATVF